MPTHGVTLLRTSAQQSHLANTTTQVDVNQLPNECPICHVTIEPEFLAGSGAAQGFDWTEVYYRCTNMRCRRQFTAFYKVDRGLSQGQSRQHFRLEACLPTSPTAPKFDAAIADLSPDFIGIYSQAAAAEGYGLSDVAGPGFRKALEFLIKDYAIKLNPTNAEEIKRIQLVPVIKLFLAGDRLPVVSSRAAWLGNDETHYERRWVGKDLKDLKRLIDATAHFIAMERLAAELPLDMPATGPTSA